MPICTRVLKPGTGFPGQHPENQKTARDYLSSVVLCVEPLIQRFVERDFTKDLQLSHNS